MSITFIDINEKLDQFFRQRGLSSYRVSKQSGISEPTINRYRQGKSQPTSNKLKELFKAYPELENFLFGKLSKSEKNLISLTEKLEEVDKIKINVPGTESLNQIPIPTIIAFIKENEKLFEEYAEYTEFINNKAKDIAINLLIDRINKK